MSKMVVVATAAACAVCWQISDAIAQEPPTDENYSFAEGFPEPGRQFFANLRARF